ncbi:MAG: hypothetical protein O3C40_23150 [Planctomycetota bacterium]|nr:hypothetical protein [Planctomycetota bacterium]
MNIQHLKAILWLRWRMSANQWRRLGLLNAIVTTTCVVGAIITSCVLFFVALIGGSVLLIHRQPSPDVLMLTWDAIVLAFLFVWLIGLITELQRSELLSLDRLLHLPLSLSAAFFLNYATSLVSLPVLIFLPGMFGLAIACIVAGGLPMLTILPLLASLMLFVTAVTYQFRGWLATLMANKRRRKTIIVAMTLSFVLMSQAPQLVNMAFMGSSSRRNSLRSLEYQQAVKELTRQLQAGEIGVDENNRRMAALTEQLQHGRKEENARFYQTFVNYVLLGNKVLPVGWLPYGVRAAALGSPLPGVLASVAMFGVGALSLWRSYTTTMRFYTGSRPAPKRAVAKPKGATARKLSNSLEPNIPFLSEHVTTIALVGFRSLLRAPESKMALLTPIILVGVFGGMILFGPGRALREQDIDWVPPFIAIGIIGVMLFGLAQLMINIFGMDRGGFRAFVLMPVRRHDVLLGKNLSVAPIAGCIAVVLIIALQFVFGMRVTHLLATLVQLVPSYLFFCLIGNTSSILAPMAIATGSLKPAQPSIGPILLQMFFMMFAPVVLLPAVTALGAETVLAQTTSVRGLPIYLVFSLIEAGLVIWIYRVVIKFQGDWLQRREPRMLEILARVPE